MPLDSSSCGVKMKPLAFGFQGGRVLTNGLLTSSNVEISLSN
jgi:hypothetical protein